MALVSANAERVAVLLSAGITRLVATGGALDRSAQPDFDARMEWVRSMLNPESFERQSELGRGMSVDDALEYGLAESAAD